MVGLDPETGKQLWDVPTSTSKAALTAPTPRKVGGDKLFVTSFYNGSMLLKVTADEAEVVWRSKAKGETPNQTTDLSSIMPTPVVTASTSTACAATASCGASSDDRQAGVGDDAGDPRHAHPAEGQDGRSRATPGRGRAVGNAFLIPNGDRYFLFNEQGDLIIAQAEPEGVRGDRPGAAARADEHGWPAGRWCGCTRRSPNKCVFVRNDKELVCYSLAK